MQISSIIRRAVAGVAAASMLVAVAACGTSKDNKTAGGEGGSGTIEVVASINQWGSVAKDLGGSHVDVTNIMTKTNVEAHDYEPTSQPQMPLSRRNSPEVFIRPFGQARRARRS